MPKRSISDKEISLIKAMLARGMKNKDIQFFFNRPDRPVNSGRITGIRNGTYSTAKGIPASSAAEVDAFIKGHASGSNVGAVVVPIAKGETPSSPISPEVLMRLFAEGKEGCWRLRSGESEQHECKTSFGL